MSPHLDQGEKRRSGIGLASLLSALILLAGPFGPAGWAVAADDLVSALILLAKPLGSHGPTARGDNPPIQLDRGGDANDPAAAETTNEITATKVNQTVSATAAYGGILSVTAAASSGLPVTITTSGACLGHGTDAARIALSSGAGTCNIHYNQAGDADHYPAPEETHSFVVTKADQDIVVSSKLPTRLSYTDQFEVAATSSAKLPVAISTSGVCAGSGQGSATVTMTSGTGTCTLHFNQAGDANFRAAPEVTGTIAAAKATLAVTPHPPTPVRQYGENNPPLVPKYAGFAPGDSARDLAEEPTCAATAGPNSPPGQYPILCSGGAASHYRFHYDNSTRLTVTAGAVSVGFSPDNPASLKVNARGRATAGLKLMVSLWKKIPDPASDGAATGDLDSAVLSVTLAPLLAGGRMALKCKSSPVTVIGYEAVKSFVCTTSRHLAVDVYAVTARVTGNYSGIAHDSVTVYDPKRNVAHGGGWFNWPGSADKTQFGFVMQADKKQPDRQGYLLVVRHRPDGTWTSLRSDTMTGVVIQNDTTTGCGNVTFNGTAEYVVWDGSVSGGRGGDASNRGQPFMAYAEDCNQPGDGSDHFLIRSVGELQMSSDVYVSKVSIAGEQGHIVIPHGPAKVR